MTSNPEVEAQATAPGRATTSNRDVAKTLEALVEQLQQLAAGDPTPYEAARVVDAIASLLPDPRPLDLLDEIMRADIPGELRAAAARHLVREGQLGMDDRATRELLAKVGPSARLALARGLHERGDHDRARGLVHPLLRAVHDDVRREAQLWYRSSPDEYKGMATQDVVRDAIDEPGWLHRAWASRELIARGEVETALESLDAVVGHWTYFRDDPACTDEPVRVVMAIAPYAQDGTADRLLHRALRDELPEVRAAAAMALGVPEPTAIDLITAEGEDVDIDLSEEPAGLRRLFSRGRR
jgi:hypothetical protein